MTDSHQIPRISYTQHTQRAQQRPLARWLLKASVAFSALALFALPTVPAKASERGGVTVEAQHPTSQPSAPLLRISADAYREVAQDLVILTLSKQVIAPQSQEVTKALNQAMQDVIEQGQGAEHKDAIRLQTGYYHLWLEGSPNANDAKDKPNYRGHAEVLVISQDVEAATAFVAGVSDTMDLSEVRFELSLALRRQVEDEIRAEAIKAFKTKAQSVAQEFGYERYELLSVELSDSQATMVPRGDAWAYRSMMAAEAAGAPSLEAGRERVSINVSGQVALH